MKKLVPWAGFAGAAGSSVFFWVGLPLLPEGWKPLVDSLSAVFACLGWATGGFAVGASAASFVIAVSWVLKMAGGNWTRIGR